MNKKRSTKRALLLSALSLLMCVSMLVGSTFAWFTDSVTSGVNKIVAGNLDVELEYKKVVNGVATDWATVEGKTDIFDPNALWEPGRVEVVYLKVSNLGTLALKYQLGVNVVGETLGKTEAGADIKLSDHLVFKVVKIEEAKVGTYTRESAMTAAGAVKGLTDYNGTTTALDAKGGANDKDYVALIVYMPETVGNEANYRGKDVPTIELGINLYATQYNAETDSFGSDYDKDAMHEKFKVTTANDLQAAINNGETNIVLENDIDLSETIVIPAAATTYSLRSTPTPVVIDLNGKTITSAMHKNVGAAIKNEGNLVLKNGTVSSTGNNGGSALLNKGTAVLENVTLNGAPNADGSWPSYTVNNTGIMDATNVKITSYHGAVASYGEGALVTLNNSEIDMAGIPGFTSHGIYAYNSGAVVVNSGVYANKATDQNATGASVINGAVTVNGGTFTGRIESYSGTPVLKGGTFSVTPKATFLADGYTTVVNNGQTIVLKGDVVASDNASLNDALANGESSVALGAGDFSLPTTNGDVTISGTTDTVITINKPTANKVALNGVTVVGSGNYTGIQHSDTVIYENCVVKGVQFLYANKVIFKNCTVDLTATPDYIWTYGAKDVEFIDCTFNTAGKAILIYNEGANMVTNVTVKGCTFNATASALAGGKVAAAIEIDSSLSTNGHYTLTTEDNTVDPDFSGEWRVKKSGTNNTTINGVIYNKVEDGLYKDDKGAFYVYNAEGLATMNTMMADKSAGRNAVMNLLADIDFSGKTWTTVDSHADTAFWISEINGNGHTISNLTINGQAMFRRFAGSGDVVIKDITFDKANVNSNGNINTSILTVQSYQNVLLDNVDVKNSTIKGSYKVASLIGTVYNERSTTVTATLKNCDISDTTIHGNLDFMIAGMIGFVYESDNDYAVFENCTVTNVTLSSNSKYYNAMAGVYCNDGTAAGSFDEVTGVTVSGLTKE